MSAPVKLLSVGNVDIWSCDGAVLWRSKMQCCFDGSAAAYHLPTPTAPHGKPPALDDLRNAGSPGNWYGVVVDAQGNPIIQGEADPNPGFCVSPTALRDTTLPATDPRSYPEATGVPYLSTPGGTFRSRCGLGLGDLATVTRNGIVVGAILAESGPASRIGEGSTCLLAQLGLPANTGHDIADVVQIAWPRTRKTPAWPRSVPEFQAVAAARFVDWGGPARLNELHI